MDGHRNANIVHRFRFSPVAIEMLVMDSMTTVWVLSVSRLPRDQLTKTGKNLLND